MTRQMGYFVSLLRLAWGRLDKKLKPRDVKMPDPVSLPLSRARTRTRDAIPRRGYTHHLTPFLPPEVPGVPRCSQL